MDFNLELGHKNEANGYQSEGGGGSDASKLARRNALLKDEIAAVKERISALKSIAGKEEYLSIPTSFVSSPAPVIIISTALRLREANEPFAQLAGLHGSDLAFDSDALNLFTPESRDKVKENVAKLVENGVCDLFESELIMANGSRRPVMVCLTKMGPTNNDCFVYFLDMTDRKAMQKELAIKQSNLAALAEAIPQLIWVSGADGVISYANEHFRSYSGICPDKAPVDWRDFLPAEDKKNLSGMSYTIGQTYAEFQTEVRLRRADGAYLWYQLKVVPFFASGGVAMNWLNLATEIDEQKRLADSLLVAEEQLRVIADAMPQIVWTADARGSVDFLNHRWFEYTGLTPEQSLHGGWRLLVHSEDLPKYEERWRNAVRASEPFEVEFRLKRALGLGGRRNSISAFRAKTSSSKTEARRDYLWHLCRAVPLKSAQGNVVRWFGTWTEIDEHRARG
jgi:PAS domain S-box-containing protein